MIQINPDASQSLRVPPLAESDFALSLTETPVVLNPGATEAIVEKDKNLIRVASAEVRFDATVEALLSGDNPTMTFRSTNEARATVDAFGKVTTTGSGTVGILAESSFLSRRVEHNARTEASAAVDSFVSFLPNTLGAALTAGVHPLAAAGGSLELFSVKDHAAATYERNSLCWAASLNFTGLSPWNSQSGAANRGRRGGTLVSPCHAICAKHFPINAGRQMRWVTASGEVHTRTVTGVVDVDVSAADVGDGLVGDFRVLKLNADLPASIAFYKVWPTNRRDYLPPFAGFRMGDIPVICSNQFGQVFIQDWFSHGTGNWVSRRLSEDPARAALFLHAIMFDSGHAVFAVLNGELIFCGTHNGIGVSLDFTQFRFAQINAAMTSLGGGYQLTTVDLSAYPTF